MPASHYCSGTRTVRATRTSPRAPNTTVRLMGILATAAHSTFHCIIAAHSHSTRVRLSGAGIFSGHPKRAISAHRAPPLKTPGATVTIGARFRSSASLLRQQSESPRRSRRAVIAIRPHHRRQNRWFASRTKHFNSLTTRTASCPSQPKYESPVQIRRRIWR